MDLYTSYQFKSGGGDVIHTVGMMDHKKNWEIFHPLTTLFNLSKI